LISMERINTPVNNRPIRVFDTVNPLSKRLLKE